ncbi:MAG: hypothetical protein ACOCRK_00870, partial [bacterium]
MDVKEKYFYKNLGIKGKEYLIEYINNNCDGITYRYLDNKLKDNIISHDGLNLENVVTSLSDYDKFINHYGDIPRNKLMPNLMSLKDKEIKKRIKNLLTSDLLGKIHAVYRDIFFKGIESFIFELKMRPNGNVSWAYLYHPEFGEYYGGYDRGDFTKYIPRIEELINEWIYYIEGPENYPGVNYHHPDEYNINHLEFKFIISDNVDRYDTNKNNLNYVIEELVYPAYLETYVEEKNLIYLDE